MAVGEYVTVSVAAEDAGDGATARWSVCNGTITSVDAAEVAVVSDANLSDLGVVPTTVSTALSDSSAPRRLLRMDKCEVASGFAICRGNVIALMAPPPAAAAVAAAATATQPSRLLELVVDQSAPRFGSEEAALASLPEDERARLGALNGQQRSAVGRVLSCEDYCLVLGMPGALAPPRV